MDHRSPAIRRGVTLAPESVALASKVVGPMLDVFHLKFYAHDFFFRLCRVGSGTGALSNGFTRFALGVVVVLHHQRDLGRLRIDFDSHDIEAAAFGRLDRAGNVLLTELLGARRRAGLFGGSPMGAPLGQIVLWGELGHRRSPTALVIKSRPVVSARAGALTMYPFRGISCKYSSSKKGAMIPFDLVILMPMRLIREW